MTLGGNDKEAASLEHDEIKLPMTGEPVELVVESVDYGYHGVKAWLSSPYVFGAALLASMGGFSYGYGKFSSQPYSLYLLIMDLKTRVSSR